MDDEIVETITEETETIDGKTYPITVIRRQRRDKKPFFFTCRGQEKWVDAVTITDAGKRGTSIVYTLHKDYTEEERREGRKRIQETGSWNKTAFGDVYPKKNCPPDRFQSGGQSEKRVAMEANGVPASVLYPCPVQGVNTRFFLGGR